MKALTRRLCRLEALVRQGTETEFSRQLLERLESASRRDAVRRERDGLPPLAGWPPDGHSKPLTIIEILHGGRDRGALAHQALAEASREPPGPATSGRHHSD